MNDTISTIHNQAFINFLRLVLFCLEEKLISQMKGFKVMTVTYFAVFCVLVVLSICIGALLGSTKKYLKFIDTQLQTQDSEKKVISIQNELSNARLSISARDNRINELEKEKAFLKTENKQRLTTINNVYKANHTLCEAEIALKKEVVDLKKEVGQHLDTIQELNKIVKNLYDANTKLASIPQAKNLNDKTIWELTQKLPTPNNTSEVEELKNAVKEFEKSDSKTESKNPESSSDSKNKKIWLPIGKWVYWKTNAGTKSVRPSPILLTRHVNGKYQYLLTYLSNGGLKYFWRDINQCEETAAPPQFSDLNTIDIVNRASKYGSGDRKDFINRLKEVKVS